MDTIIYIYQTISGADLVVLIRLAAFVMIVFIMTAIIVVSCLIDLP